MNKIELVKEVFILENKIKLSDNKDEIINLLKLIKQMTDNYLTRYSLLDSDSIISKELKVLAVKALDPNKFIYKNLDIESLKFDIYASIGISLISLTGFGIVEINTIVEKID